MPDNKWVSNALNKHTLHWKLQHSYARRWESQKCRTWIVHMNLNNSFNCRAAIKWRAGGGGRGWGWGRGFHPQNQHWTMQNDSPYIGLLVLKYCNSHTAQCVFSHCPSDIYSCTRLLGSFSICGPDMLVDNHVRIPTKNASNKVWQQLLLGICPIQSFTNIYYIYKYIIYI